MTETQSFSIRFDAMQAVADVETEVRAWLQKLATPLTRAGIASGQVVIACKGERRHGQGLRHHVQMELNGEGRMITIGLDPSEIHPHEDVYVAIRDAFRVLRRRLDQNARPLPQG